MYGKKFNEKYVKRDRKGRFKKWAKPRKKRMDKKKKGSHFGLDLDDITDMYG